MRISDWSSDVCSSDLSGDRPTEVQQRDGGRESGNGRDREREEDEPAERERERDEVPGEDVARLLLSIGHVHRGHERVDGPGGAPGGEHEAEQQAKAEAPPAGIADPGELRSEEHTSELQSLM